MRSGSRSCDDPRDLLHWTGLAGVDGDPHAVLASPSEQAAVVGHPERRGLRAGDVDADHTPVTPRDGLLHDDLVELVRERAIEAEQEPGLHRVLQRRLVHTAHRSRDDVVEILLAAPVPLHRVEAQLHRRDVVLAVGAADDLVHGALDGDRARLDELSPVEQLEIAVEALGAPGMDSDQVAELPVVAGGQLDALRVGDRPHDRRRDGRPEVAVELGERDLAAQDGRHARRISRQGLKRGCRLGRT